MTRNDNQNQRNTSSARAATTRLPILFIALVLALMATACGNSPDSNSPAQSGGDGDTLAGAIAIDGSSTVGPLTDAIAEEYAVVQPDVEVNIGISGTGGGFKRFCSGDIQIANASRPIKEEERAICTDAGIDFTEVRVGTDALTMVTSHDTDWVDCLTVPEVRALWQPNGAKTWKDLRASFPDEKLTIFAPGVDSGTYDFLTEEILGKDVQARADYSASEDDNIIAQGVIGSKGSWGFFGFAYFQENADTLRSIAFDAGEGGCVQPSIETAQDGSYGLSRPLYVYVRNDAFAQPHIADFVTFYLETVSDVIDEVGYIAEPAAELAKAKDTVAAAIAAAKA